MIHLLIMVVAVCAVVFATRFPTTSSARELDVVPSYSLSGVAGNQARTDAYLRPGASQVTRQSVSGLIVQANASSVRATGGVVSSFSSGVSAAAASSGESGAGVRPLAEIVDPTRPFLLYRAQPGDSASLVAEKFGISLGTLLDNNPTLEDGALLLLNQELVVPRKDGILYKVALGDSVDTIVRQYDNITTALVISYRPNGLSEGDTIKPGQYLLLPGATRKPPPPPPEPPRPAPRPTSGGGSTPPPNSGGRFSFPLSGWHGISDPFGTYRGVGRIHEGIDFDLWGRPNSSIFSACNGVVTRVEYLTYSYGYYVEVDCGDGWSTLYAHFSQIVVVPGQRVSQGTLLGYSGVTGYTTGEHLHFEIRLWGAPLDPAYYLDL
jgi:murein DD-endopeptidase MepM/ murein hydrolase activator NlpD